MDKTPNAGSLRARSTLNSPQDANASTRETNPPDEHRQPSLHGQSPRTDTRDAWSAGDGSGAQPADPTDRAEDFVIHLRRVVPASPLAAPSGSASAIQSVSSSSGGLPATPSASVASSVSLSASAELNNCTARDTPHLFDSGKEAGGKLPAPLPDNRVFASDLGQKTLATANAILDKQALLSPVRLGELLVAVESKGGKLKLEGDKVTRILRDGLTIRDFHPLAGGKPFNLNIIENATQPFMDHHLATGDLERLRKAVWKDWLKVTAEGRQIAGKGPERGNQAEDEARNQVIKPVIDMICGEPRSLANSKLPKPIKELLLSIDRNIIHWFTESGSGDMQILFDARRNALIAFLSTRSLGYVWLGRLISEVRHDAGMTKSATQLIQYLNSQVAKHLDDFLLDIMRSQSDQPPKVAKYLELKAGNRTLKSRLGQPRSDDQGSAASSWDQVLSPRKLAPRAVGREAKKKEMDVKLERAKYADHLAACAGLDQLDHGCYQYIKDRLLKVSQRGFDNVRKDPVRFALEYARAFYAEHTLSDSDKPAQVAKAIQGLNRADHPDLFLTVSGDESRPDEQDAGPIPSSGQPKAKDTDSDDSLVDSVDEDSPSQ